MKLLYDVLDVSSAQINKAILYVTKNTLVCETAEDARKMAYEIDKHTNYDVIIIIVLGIFFAYMVNIIYLSYFSVFHWMDVFIVKMV